ncbi:MAG: hypothetical protein GXO82_08265 [Chlorobi bacterium]|nr:hypothetical protein [Chlorobiota bacterium]
MSNINSKNRILLVIAFVLFCVPAQDVFSQVRKIPVFPDTLVGRKLIGVLRYNAEELPKLLKEKAQILMDYRCLNLYIASYGGTGNDDLAVELYEFKSSLEAFGLFSVLSDTIDFNGQPDYAVSKVSNRIQVNLGTYVGFIYPSDPEADVEIPPRVVDDIFFLLNDVTSLELLRIPLPFDERARGSIRFVQGRAAWRMLKDPVVRVVLPVVDTLSAYFAEYRKERLRITRKLFAFPVTAGESLDTLYSAIYSRLEKAGSLHGMEHNVAWFDVAEKQAHLVKMRDKVFLVIAAADDPGAFEWMVYESSKDKKR